MSEILSAVGFSYIYLYFVKIRVLFGGHACAGMAGESLSAGGGSQRGCYDSSVLEMMLGSGLKSFSGISLIFMSFAS